MNDFDFSEGLQRIHVVAAGVLMIVAVTPAEMADALRSIWPDSRIINVHTAAGRA